MWNFFNRPTKPKYGKWLTFFGGSCIPSTRATIRCLWWQYFLLLIICIAALSLWTHEQTMPASTSLPQYNHRQNILKSLHIPDQQYSVNLIPFWKRKLWKKLKDHSVPDNIRASVNPSKPYKRSRRFKRDRETSQNGDGSSQWTSALNVILRQIFGNHIIPLLPKTVANKSVFNDNVRSLLDNQEPLQNLNNLRIASITSNFDNKSPVHLPNEETTELISLGSLISSESSIAAFKSLSSEERTSHVPLSKMSMNSTEWKNSNSSITDLSDSTIKSSSDMVNLTSLPLSSIRFTKPSDSSYSVNKTSFPEVNHPNTMATASFEMTTTSLPFNSFLTRQPQTSSFIQPTMAPNANVDLSDIQESGVTPSIDSPSIFTSNLEKKAVGMSSPFVNVSVPPLTRGTLDSSFNTNADTTDGYQMVSNEKMMEKSSSVIYSKPVTTSYASYNQYPEVGPVLPVTSFTNLQTSNMVQTSEHDLNLGEQTRTAVPWAQSTWSVSRLFQSSEENYVSSDVESAKNKSCVLQPPTTTIAQATFKLSKTSSFFTTLNRNTHGMDNITSESQSLTLDGEKHMHASATELNMFTSGLSTEADFPTTVTLAPFAHERFNDGVNDNENLNQSIFELTSTQSSKRSSVWVSSLVASVSQQKESLTSPDLNTSTTEEPQHFIVTKDDSTTSNYSNLNVSLSARTAKESPYSTTMPVWQDASESSSYHLSTTAHKVNTMLFSTGKDLMTEQTAVSKRKVQTLYPSSPESNEPTSSSSYWTPRTSPRYTSKHMMPRLTAVSQSKGPTPRSPKSNVPTGSSSYWPPKTSPSNISKRMMPRLTAVSQSKGQTPSSPKSNVTTGSSSYSTQKISPTWTMTSFFKLLISTERTSGQPSGTKAFQYRNEEVTPSQPALKLLIPQFMTDFPPQPSTSYSVMSTSSLLVKVPVNFYLMGVLYSKQLSNYSSDEYKRLEREVKLVMNKIFSNKYTQEYVQTEITEFLNGSVAVRSNIVFDSSLPAPSGSDVVRTVLTDVYEKKTNYFGWNINGSTVEAKGYTQKNLESESLSISLLVLRAGFIAVAQNYQEKQSFVENLQKQVFQIVNTSFPVSKVDFSQIRDVHGDLEVRGTLYLNTHVHTNVQSLLSTLLPLVNTSVDFSSVVVDGMHTELYVHTIYFRVINKAFVVSLLDMSSPESQKLSKDLSTVVQSALHESNPVQVIIREFKSGSIMCKGDLLYRLPAPGSREILRMLLDTLGSDGILGSSSYQVDSKTVTVGDSSPGPYSEYVGFPGFGVAIIVMCGLSILIFPTLIYMCYKTRMLGHRKKATIRQPHNPDIQSHHFEMDNRAFRASIEQP